MWPIALFVEGVGLALQQLQVLFADQDLALERGLLVLIFLCHFVLRQVLLGVGPAEGLLVLFLEEVLLDVDFLDELLNSSLISDRSFSLEFTFFLFDSIID